MKILTAFFKISEKKPSQTVSDQQRESMIRQGREQFKKLTELGLNVPVALL